MRAEADSADDRSVVVVTIRLTEIDPPTGVAWVDGRPALTFAGWLGLLRVLSELLGAATR